MRFAHALIREALYEGIPAVRRRRIHRRAGEALAERHHVDADAVAFHFQRADDDRALPWLLAAGERAQAAYAWTTAATRFEAALALMERADADAGARGWLLLRLARLLRFAEVTKARAFADEAYALGLAAGDGALAAYARFQRGLLGCIAGNVALGLPEMEAGAAALAALSDAERAVYGAHAAGLARRPRWTGTVVLWRADVGRYREARELGERLRRGGGGDDEMLRDFNDRLFGLGDRLRRAGDAGRGGDDVRPRPRRLSRHGPSFRRLLRVVEDGGNASPCPIGRKTSRGGGDCGAGGGGVRGRGVPSRHRSRRASCACRCWWWRAVGRGRATGGDGERRGSGQDISFRASALGYLAALARLRGDAERARWAVREDVAGGQPRPSRGPS